MIWFVSGIDTDAGKSYVTAGLLKYLLDRKCRATTFKLVQTGSPDGRSIDIDLHRRLTGMPEDDFDRRALTRPAVFSYPASPHLAAAIDHRKLDFSAIENALAEVDAAFDFVLVEGAGGLMVPLTRNLLTVDYAAGKHWPLILVTSGKLGSINHTLLSIEAAERRGMTVAAVVYNRYPQIDEIIEAETQSYLREKCPGAWIEMPVVTGERLTEAPDCKQLFGV